MSTVDVLHPFSPISPNDRDWLSDGLSNGPFKTRGERRRQNSVNACSSPFKGSLSTYQEDLNQKIKQSRERCLGQQRPPEPTEDPKSSIPKMSSSSTFSSAVCRENAPSLAVAVSRAEERNDIEEVKRNEEEIRQKLTACRLMQQEIYQTYDKQVCDTQESKDNSLVDLLPTQTREKHFFNGILMISTFFLKINLMIQQVWSVIVAFIKGFQERNH